MSGTCRRGSSTSASKTSSTSRTTALRRAPGARADGCQPAGNRMTNQVGHQGAGGQETSEVDAGLVADVIEQVAEFLGGQVAGRPVGERRPTEAADGRVETAHAEIEGGVRIYERRA